VTQPEKLAETLSAGLAEKGVAVIEVVVSKEENVFPIVPAGANACDMIFSKQKSSTIVDDRLPVFDR
jgi:acetolactate synthase-1/2/3 large subunit